MPRSGFGDGLVGIGSQHLQHRQRHRRVLNDSGTHNRIVVTGERFENILRTSGMDRGCRRQGRVWVRCQASQHTRRDSPTAPQRDACPPIGMTGETHQHRLRERSQRIFAPQTRQEGSESPARFQPRCVRRGRGETTEASPSLDESVRVGGAAQTSRAAACHRHVFGCAFGPRSVARHHSRASALNAADSSLRRRAQRVAKKRQRGHSRRRVGRLPRQSRSRCQQP